MAEFEQTFADLVAAHRWEDLKSTLNEKNPMDLAGLITSLPASERALVFRLLDKRQAVEVFESLEVNDQQELLASFRDEQARDLVEHMSPDDRAYLLDEVPAKVAKRLLRMLSPAERDATALLLGYKENTAGRIMTPEYIDLKSFMSVSDALLKIRRVGLDKETVYYCYVTDEQRRLTGIISLKDLVLADPEAKIANLMKRQVVAVHTDEDQEEVVHKIKKYDLLAIPVVDRENRLVGIITHDDIMDVLEDETTEDIYRLGAVQVPEQSYFKSGMLAVASRRVGWLLVLLITNTFTGNIIMHQTQLLHSVIALAAFVPLLTGSGGNIGAQTSAVMVRGWALQEVTFSNALKLLLREVGIGLFLGSFLGFIVIFWAFWLQGNWWVSIAVGSSLILISTLATLFGSLLPLIFVRLGLDPAVVSAPFITTMVDVLGVFTYFQVAKFILFH
ncbi:MAG: magnesium transporter [Deltaproteobacteria bacterium]|nr:magnesium transporter [Deltaproteobacteria bacterium]MBW1952707.1 magnesium transporter [Deltaproteobacteria bacterium]MBW1986297.1 magnesium transporter [Deltaproteobacteria bacterium]MBW2134338.1 magnesium transporter [Deltaproteobacteria bacterium]